MKYYKGLGTSTGKEFKEYFAQKKIVRFSSSGTDCRDALDMVFNKARACDRKTWLGAYDRKLFLNTNQDAVTYQQFVGREMIHFSKYDCDRSIPNMMDGLKTSQRKILYTTFKRNLRAEIKVAQLSGSVSELSCYHHGEASLNGAIKGMAQTYVGSNNINLLEPKGQFGTRLRGGDDAASERYIHTHLSPIARALFPEADDDILRYLDDDGTPVEPVFYAPVIPLALVNGAKGIGTGFSTDIPSYNPQDLIKATRAWLDQTESDTVDLVPYFEGFKGRVEPMEKGKFAIRGSYEVVGDNQIHVTELPVGFWTDDFKQLLENLAEPQGKSKKGVVKDYRDMSTDTRVDVTVTLVEPNAAALHAARVMVSGASCTGVEKLLRLCSVRSTSNMNLFDANERLRKFATPQELVDVWCQERVKLYEARHTHLKEVIIAKVQKATNKQRFIEAMLDGSLDMRGKSRAETDVELEARKFDRDGGDFKYLTRMPMDTLCKDAVEALRAEVSQLNGELFTIGNTLPVGLWRADLDALEAAYAGHLQQRAAAEEAADEGTGVAKKKRRIKRVKKSA